LGILTENVGKDGTWFPGKQNKPESPRPGQKVGTAVEEKSQLTDLGTFWGGAEKKTKKGSASGPVNQIENGGSE